MSGSVASPEMAVPPVISAVAEPSAAEWAARVDRKLLSFAADPRPVVRSLERRIEVGGPFSFDGELALLFSEFPQSSRTFSVAEKNLHTGSIIGVVGLGGMLTSAGLAFGSLAVNNESTVIALLVTAGVLLLASTVCALVGAFFMQDASRGLLEAIDQYNHALLRLPSP